jgi:hypothetical protein
VSRLKSHDQAGTAPEYIRFKLNGVRRLIDRLHEAEVDIISDVTAGPSEEGKIANAQLQVFGDRAVKKRDYIKGLIDHLQEKIEEGYGT